MKRLSLAILVIILGGIAAAGEEAPRRDWKLRNALTGIKVAREAESVVLARIKEVHKSPGIWCGFLMTRQEVTYEVVELLYGVKVPGTIRFGHLLVSGTNTVLKDTPHLKWNRFYPGARAILCLKRVKDVWVPVEEDYGVILVDPPISPDPEVRELCRLTLGLQALEPYLHAELSERLPVRVAISPAVRMPLDLMRFGKGVVFAHPEALKGTPHLVFTRMERGETEARVEFTYAVEGVAGDVQFTWKEGGWTVRKVSVVER